MGLGALAGYQCLPHWSDILYPSQLSSLTAPASFRSKQAATDSSAIAAFYVRNLTFNYLTAVI